MKELYDQLLRIYLLELNEKLVYLADYLEESRSEGRRAISILDSLQVVNKTLDYQLSVTARNIQHSPDITSQIPPTPDPDDTLPPKEVAKNFGRLLRITDRFLPVHDALYWTYTPWAEDETYAILRSLFEHPADAGLYERLNPTIAFIPEFSFVYTESHRYWLKIPGITQKGSLLALPKLARRDCLMWPLLGHELAHAIYNELELEKRLAKKLVHVPGESAKRWLTPKILNWLTELTCDLLALRLFGPSYFLAFGGYFLFFYGGDLRRSSDTHPAPWDRIQLMGNYLLDEWGKNQEQHTPSPFQEVSFWLKLFDCKSRLQQSSEGILYDYESAEESKDYCEPIGTCVKDNLAEIAPEIPEFPASEWALADASAKVLHEGITISSGKKSDYGRVQELLQKQDVSTVAFDEICSLMNDAPIRPVTILNAGWLLKVRRYRTDFFKKDDIFPWTQKSAAECGARFRQLNWLVQKSIEMSLVHSFYLE